MTLFVDLKLVNYNLCQAISTAPREESFPYFGHDIGNIVPQKKQFSNMTATYTAAHILIIIKKSPLESSVYCTDLTMSFMSCRNQHCVIFSCCTGNVYIIIFCFPNVSHSIYFSDESRFILVQNARMADLCVLATE